MPQPTPITDIISGVRARLGHPSTDKIRLTDIVLTINQVAGNYKTQMKLTSEQWFIQKGEFTAPALISEYSIPLENYAKAITVEWINPYAPNEPGVEIQIVNFTSLDLVPINRPRTIVNSQTAPAIAADNIAHAIAFTGMPPNLRARIVPQPQEQARYRVYYIPNNSPVVDINGDLEFPQEFIQLLIFGVANSLLGNCGYDQQTYIGYKSGISSDLALASHNFQVWVGQSKKQSARSSRGYMPPGSGWRR